MNHIKQCCFLAALIVGLLAEPVFNTEQTAWAEKSEQIHRKNIKAFEEIITSFELNDYEATSKLINKLSESPKLNNLEQAYIANFRGDLCFINDDLTCSRLEFKKILEKKSAVPENFYYKTVFSLASLSFKQENYAEFSVYAQEYLSNLPSMVRSKNILVGQSYFAAQDYDKALSFVLTQLENRRSSNEILRSKWVYFLIDIYTQLNQLEDALEFIDSMDEINPKTQYKLRVAESYAEIGMPEKAQLLRKNLVERGLAGYKNDKLITWNTEGSLRPIYRPNPIYPYKAMKRRQEGWVELMMDIDKFGKTSNIRIIKSSRKKTFDKAAMNAAQGYVFEPVIKNGEPAVLQDHTIRIGFQIGDRKKESN